MRKIILVCILIMLTSSLAWALPTLETGNVAPASFKCHDYQAAEKYFYPDSTQINVGLVCNKDAKITLYECTTASCDNKNMVDTGYKISGKFPFFTGFFQSLRYYYQCWECTDMNLNSAPEIITKDYLSVREGQELSLKAQCTDKDGDKTQLTYSGWITSAKKAVSYTDAGDHETILTCTDEWDQQTSQTVKISVADVNRPPQIISVKEGD